MNAPQAASDNDSFGFETSSTPGETQVENYQFIASAPVGLTAAAKPRVAKACSGERAAGFEGEKPSTVHESDGGGGSSPAQLCFWD